MPIIVDASVTAAWMFADERCAYAIAALRQVERQGGYAPALWRWEVQNVLLFALRRKRISESQLAEFVADLQALPLEIDSADAFGVELALAREHALTVYDAAYLEVAMRRNCSLATMDEELAQAARSCGIYFTSG